MPDGSEGGRDGLREGARVGRYVVVRDIEGHWYAVAAGAVSALREGEDGTTIAMLPGGKLMHLPQPLQRVLAWLDGRPG